MYVFISICIFFILNFYLFIPFSPNLAFDHKCYDVVFGPNILQPYTPLVSAGIENDDTLRIEQRERSSFKRPFKEDEEVEVEEETGDDDDQSSVHSYVTDSQQKGSEYVLPTEHVDSDDQTTTSEESGDDDERPIDCAGGRLGDIFDETPVFCPEHNDDNPAGFVGTDSKSGRYLPCSGCGGAGPSVREALSEDDGNGNRHDNSTKGERAVKRRRVTAQGPVRKAVVGVVYHFPSDICIWPGELHCVDSLSKADIVDVAASSSHWAAIDKHGVLYTWGNSDHGALGREGAPEKPITVKLEHDIAKVCCGHSFTAALDTDGRLYAWGAFKDIEDNCSRISEQPKLIEVCLNHGETFVDIQAGAVHIQLLTSDGRIFTWGHGEQHQLGRTVIRRHKQARSAPTALGLKYIERIECGLFHSFAIAKDSTVYAWGLNEHGQTGITPVRRRSVACFVSNPTAVGGLEDQVKQISAVKVYSLVLYNDGSVATMEGDDMVLADLPLVQRVYAGLQGDIVQTVDGCILQWKADDGVWGIINGRITQQRSRKNSWHELDGRCELLTIAPGMVLAVPQKLLLVLDLNGVLYHKRPDTARPYLLEFLAFVFEHFDVMVWSSAAPLTVDSMIKTYFWRI